MAFHEVLEYQDAPRALKQAIVRDLAERVLAIVTDYHPEPVLAAEIEAQITEQTPFVDTAAGEEIGKTVSVSDFAVAMAREQATRKGDIVPGMRGNQLTYRLPVDAIEAKHVTT